MFKFVVLFLVLLVWIYPDKIGYWKAQFDISHESIMNEYYADCDCGEWLK
jgi:hypothetical protein